MALETATANQDPYLIGDAMKAVFGMVNIRTRSVRLATVSITAALFASAAQANCFAPMPQINVCDTENATIDPTYLNNPGLAGQGSATLYLKTTPRVSVFIKRHNRNATARLLETIYQQSDASGVDEAPITHQGLSGTTYVYRTSKSTIADNLLNITDGLLLVAVERPEKHKALPPIRDLNAMSLATVFPVASK